MTFRPGDLIGLPVLGPAAADAIVLRYVLLALAMAGAFLALRGRRLPLVLTAALFVEVALLFWSASLARPYGLFVDPAVTRAAAEAAAARLPGEEGALSGEPRPPLISVRLARAGLMPAVVIALPTLLPLLVVPLLALAIFALWRREESAVAAVLWLVFSTTDAAALRGGGFLPGLWSHPVHALALVVLVATTLGAGRAPWRPLRLPLAATATLALALLPRSGAGAPLADRLLATTVEQGPWILLGAYGLARTPSPVTVALVFGAGTLFLLGPAAADPWATHAAYRLGLILASARSVLDLARLAATSLAPARWRERFRGAPERLGFAAWLVLTMPGSFVARWTPAALDPVLAASQVPLATNMMPAFAWVRAHVPEQATCVASPEYAAMVAVLGGRRVLRAPELGQPADDQRRRRAERMLLAGREPELARRYQIGCVFFAHSDVGWLGTAGPDALDAVPSLAPGHADAYARVYRLRAATSSR